MSSIQFKWSDVWNFYEGADDEGRQSIELEIVKDDWIFRQTSKTQLEVLTEAPKPYVQTIVSRLKPETCLKLKVNPYMSY